MNNKEIPNSSTWYRTNHQRAIETIPWQKMFAGAFLQPTSQKDRLRTESNDGRLTSP